MIFGVKFIVLYRNNYSNLCITEYCAHLANMKHCYLRGWLPTSAVSQELILIVHHYGLISWLCAWRPVLGLTFSEGKACSTTQRKWGEGERFLHGWMCVKVNLLFYLWLCFSPTPFWLLFLMENFSSVCHRVCYLFWIKQEKLADMLIHSEKIPKCIDSWDFFFAHLLI